MKKEKILKISMLILLIVIFSITIAIVVLKYDKKYNITSQRPKITKEIAIQIIESNYDITNMELEVKEKENCFVVFLKNKDTNEIEKELAISKKNAKISEVQHATVTAG